MSGQIYHLYTGGSYGYASLGLQDCSFVGRLSLP